MTVKAIAVPSAPLADEHELPTLLRRGRRHCKTSHGPAGLANRKLAPESKSTGGFTGALRGSLVSQASFESSKSFGACQSKSSEEEFVSADSSTASDCCQKAFPLKAEPLMRWRAAARIQAYLAKFRKGKLVKMSKEPEISKVEVSERSPHTWIHYWPEEPDAPTREDLEALAELESMLIEHHGTMAAAYKFVMNCMKSHGDSQCNVTKRGLRTALRLKVSKEAHLNQTQSVPGSDGLEQMFDRLLTLLRKRDGVITKAEFLGFPELLLREFALQEKLSSVANANDGLLLGGRLRERLLGPIESPEEALELFQKAAVALQLEPCRTTNVLFQIGSEPCFSGNPSGLTSAISNIMQIAQRYAAPNSGLKLDVLLAGWTLCDALAKQVIDLGAPPPPPPPPQSTKNQKSLKPCLTSKTRSPSKPLGVFGRRYQCKVDASVTPPSQDNHESDCKAAFWQALPTDEVLWNVACGAEVLKDEDFKALLRIAWALFDDFDAVVLLLGPVGMGRLRPKLDALAALNLKPHVDGKGHEHARIHLQNAATLLQQIASICEADPRLARIAALFGVSFLADRIRSTVNGSVNFADGAMGSAAAQVNRSVASVDSELMLQVEELMGGRKVECRLSDGLYKIVPATKVENPLASWHQDVTAQVLANAKVKAEAGRPNSEEHDRLSAPELVKRPNSAENHRRQPVDKYLLGYSNLQGL